jgi:phage terminase large subunit-like protein
VGVLQTPRGNGKSSLGGALATWALYDDDATGAPQVPIVATTITQAIRSCYGVALSMIRNEPELLGRSLIYTGISQPRVVVPYDDGEMFPISNDPDGLLGLDPSLAIVDEMGFQSIESWDHLRLASGKRQRSLTLGLGTPGLDRENAMYHLRSIVAEGGPQRGVVYHEHAAAPDCAIADRRAWRIANPALRSGFLRASALETDLAITPETHFRIFRLGQWYEGGVDSWLGDDARTRWEALTSPWDFTDGAPTWVGVDVGIKHDSSAVVALQEREDGRYHAIARVWAPQPDRPVDVTDVMQYLRELCQRYAVAAISFDPRFFDVPAKYLHDEGLPMIEVPQSPERMTKAIGGLYEAIMHDQVTHDGDAVFSTHVLNAVPRYNERGFTLAKSKSRGHIDAVIALALAYDRVQRREPEAVPLVALR